LEIIITRKARNDLYDFFFKSKGNMTNYILDYINDVLEYIEMIKQSPLIGRALYSNKQITIRQLIHRKHRILYIILNNDIYILRILHTARKFNPKSKLNLKDYPEI